MLCYKLTKPREAEHLTLRVVSLYQPVGVEQDAMAIIEFDLLLLVTHIPAINPRGIPLAISSSHSLLCHR